MSKQEVEALVADRSLIGESIRSILNRDFPQGSEVQFMRGRRQWFGQSLGAAVEPGYLRVKQNRRASNVWYGDLIWPA